MSKHTDASIQSKELRLGQLLEQNQLVEAKDLLADMCRGQQADARLWLMYGAINQQLGDNDTAATAYKKTVAMQPGLAVGHYQLGTLNLETGKTEQAVESLQRAVALQPDFLEARCNLGSALEKLGRYGEASDCYRDALRLNPGMPELHHNLGNALHALGHHEDAEQSYREAIRLRPGYVEAHDHLGVVLAKQNRYEEAIASYHQALAIRPDHAAAHYNLAMSLKHLNRLDEAVASYRRALAINPRDSEARVNLGIALVEQKRFNEAIDHYHEALRLKPDDADAHNNLGVALVEQQKIDEAIACYREALRLKPDDGDAHFNLSLLLLLQGNFRDGWQEYQWFWRRKVSAGRPLQPSPWDGSNLNGQNVFLHGEQGLGDEFFFLRFVPWLRRHGAGTITYRSDPRIATLLSRAKEIDRIAAAEELPLPGDLVFAIGDLPRLLGMVRVDQIPPSLTLTPLPQHTESMRTRLAQLGPPPYVGVTWRAGTSAKRGSLYKECPLPRLAETLRATPATALALQRKPLPGEAEGFSQALGRPVHDLSILNEDLEQMLALLALIDDYVGVSNTNMHLRAGVGRTARVLVPAPPEWRWMAEGEKSPWFPGFTVYRQGYNRSWDEAFDMLATDLKQAYSV